MRTFAGSYLGRLRQVVGNLLILMPGAGCVLERDDGTVLFQKRVDNGLWCLPSGYAEKGEDIVQAMKREVREETGLEVLDAGPCGFPSDPIYQTVRYPNGDVVQAFGMDFFSRSWRGKVRCDGEETSELDGLTPDDLPQVLQGHDRSVFRFQEYKRTGEFQLY